MPEITERRLEPGQTLELQCGEDYVIPDPPVMLRGGNIGVLGVGDGPPPRIKGTGGDVAFRLAGREGVDHITFKRLAFESWRRAIEIELAPDRPNGPRDIWIENCTGKFIAGEGDSSFAYLGNCHKTTFRRCAVYECGKDARDHGLVYANGACTNVHVEDCFVSHARDFAQIRGTGTKITGCVGYNNHIGLDLYGGTGPMPANSTFVLERNLFLGMEKWGIRLYKPLLPGASRMRMNVVAAPVVPPDHAGSQLVRLERQAFEWSAGSNVYDGFHAPARGWDAEEGEWFPLPGWERQDIAIRDIDAETVIDHWHEAQAVHTRNRLLYAEPDLLAMLNGEEPPPAEPPTVEQRLDDLEQRVATLEQHHR